MGYFLLIKVLKSRRRFPLCKPWCWTSKRLKILKTTALRCRSLWLHWLASWKIWPSFSTGVVLKDSLTTKLFCFQIPCCQCPEAERRGTVWDISCWDHCGGWRFWRCKLILLSQISFGQVVDTRLLKAQVKAILGELKKFYCHVLPWLVWTDLDFCIFARGF